MFGLQFGDFEFSLYKNGTTLTQEHEEDYAIQALESFREKDHEIDIVVNFSRKKPNRFGLISQLKADLSNNSQMIDVLFGLLSNSNLKTGDAVWELIKFLPVNQKVKSDILQIKTDVSEKNWQTFLDFPNSRKCLYSLEIIEGIMNESYDSDWVVKFAEKGGFNYLYNVFVTVPAEFLNEKFNFKVIAMLIKLLMLYLKSKFEKICINDKNFTEILTSRSLEFLWIGLQNALKSQNDVKLPEEFCNNLLDFLLFSVNQDGRMTSLIMEMPNLAPFLYSTFFELNDMLTQKLIKDKLLLICEFSEKAEEKNLLEIPRETLPLNCFLFLLCVKEFVLKLDLFQFKEKCFHFFDFLNYLGMGVRENQKETLLNLLDIRVLFNFLLKLFQSLPIYEKNQGEADFLLQGVLKLFQILLKFCPEFKTELLKNEAFTKELTYKCLFEMPSNQTAAKDLAPPKCKNPESRSLAFDLLRLLITSTDCDIKFITVALKELFLSALWRSSSSSDWNLVGIDSDKSRTGYVGLRNLGSTCYMNSLFQQFFMIQDFREALLQIKNIDESEKSSLYHFQLILEALKSSQKPYYDARQFCSTYKNNEGMALNVLEQMDVDEFFNNFLERLETQLKGTRFENIIQKTFGGVLSDELIGKDGCSHYREKEELFLSVSLQVKNKKSIQNSLDSFIQGEILEGPNAFFCEKCSKKVKTLKRVCVKKLPNMLILVLKRFEFNYETMTKIKLNDFCEFPLNIDMTPYTQSFLKDPEGDKPFPDDYYNYTLKGAVIHVGTADSGHYYSLIKDTSKKSPEWFEFNDTFIKKFDINDLPFEAFGGEDKSMMEYSQSVREKSHNAYLLFYQRAKIFDDSGNEIESLMHDFEETTQEGSESLEFIKADNLRYHINKILLDHSLELFFVQIGSEIVKSQELSPNSFELAKLILFNFLIVGLRSKDRDRLPKNLRTIKELLTKSLDLSKWLVSQISFNEILREFLIDCSVEDMRYIFVGIVRTALTKICEKNDGLSFEEFKQESCLASFILACLSVVIETKGPCQHFFTCLHILAKMSAHSRKFIKETQFLSFLKEFTLEEPFTMVLPSKENDYQMKCELKPIMFQGKGLSPAGQNKHPNGQPKVSLDKLAKEFSYMIVLLSDLILNNEYLREELEILDNEEFLRKSLKISRKKITFLALSRVLAFYARESIEFSKKLMEILFIELGRCEEYEMKVCWICCEEMLGIKDQFSEERIQTFIDKFMNFIEKNSMFYKAMEISFNQWVKINGRNDDVLKAFSQYFVQNEEKYRLLEKWLYDTKDIYYGLESKRNILRRKQEGVYAYSFYLNSDKQKRKTEKRLKKLRKISDNNKDNLMFSVDSDDDFSSRTLKVGDKIDYYFIKAYHSCRIEDSMEEMYKIKDVESNFQRWIYFDDENIYPFKAMQDHTEDFFDYYK